MFCPYSLNGRETTDNAALFPVILSLLFFPYV